MMPDIKLSGRIALLLTTLLASAALAQDAANYPAKPVRWILPFAGGGPADALARVTAEQLSARLGQPVLIENRPGGNAMIGLEAIGKSAPDGYTLGTGGALQVTIPQLTPVSFRPVDDFAPIARFADISLFFVASPSMPAKSIGELVAYLKANPGKVNYGILGVGLTDHLLAELFGIQTGTKMQPVLYKGAALILQDLLAGRIEMQFISSPSLIASHLESGKLRLLAVASNTRVAYSPNTPTLAEQGVANTELPAYHALVGPAGIPRPIAARLEQAMREVVASPAIAEAYKARSAQPSFLGGDALMQQMRREWDLVAKIIREAGIKAQ
jgi:tripartite-type tricarboxylate transporter receptor subunit TctC